jgi:hypothetical protein
MRRKDLVNYEIGETNQSGFDQKGVDAGQHYANLVFSGVQLIQRQGVGYCKCNSVA